MKLLKSSPRKEAYNLFDVWFIHKTELTTECFVNIFDIEKKIFSENKLNKTTVNSMLQRKILLQK